MKNCSDYLKRVTLVHNEMVQHLVNNGDTPSLELAAMFENAANLYLDISDEISMSQKKSDSGITEETGSDTK